VQGYRDYRYGPTYGILIALRHESAVSSVHRASYKRLLARLREARLNSGLRQVDVAKRLKRRQSYVSDCESGERRVDVVELYEFAKLYGVSMKWFIDVIEDE
jgi:ribosome-binding protein aMBF1 (putative translation factor)